MSATLQDRIAEVIATTGHGELDEGFSLRTAKCVAQEIIDSLGLTAYTCCDECTSVTVDGHYDTTFD